MDARKLTAAALAGMIDHTYLKANDAAPAIEKLCAEAAQYGFATVMVHPAQIERCLSLLRGTAVQVGTVAGFPLGQNTSRVKAFETEDALERGAREIDMVINVSALQAGDAATVEEELAALSSACRRAGAVSKVILETCYLSDAQKRQACRIAVEEGVDFVKTSTGLGPGGATVQDIRLMREAVGPDTGVKAAGGIRDLATALAMIEAGATRLGASASVAIVEEMKQRRQA
jgi:deoxyribose-phosphate aldolase